MRDSLGGNHVRRLVPLMMAGALACSKGEHAPSPSSHADQGAASPGLGDTVSTNPGASDSLLYVADSSVLALAGAWFLAHRRVDLTGDSRLDSVILRADGPTSDSLTVTLRFLVDGAERWRQDWHSGYMLIDPPEFADGEVGRAAYIREDLLRTLRTVEVSSFDSSGYAFFAEAVDSAILVHPPRQQVSFAYGYESALVLVWDSTKGEFRLLWGCC